MKNLFVIAIMICAVFVAQAQKVKGDLSPLKGQSKVNVEFVYDGVTYDGDSEADFFKDHSDRDDFEQWKKDWTGSFRSDMWEPEFLEELNDEIEGLHMTFGEFAGTTYTMIVKINDIDPGSFAGPFSVPCMLAGEISIVKTGSSESIATISFSKVAGNGFQLTPIIEHRVKFAYDELGETIGEVLKKKIK